MARYGAQDTTPFTEDMICKLQDPYGIAKYGAELMLKIVRNSRFGTSYSSPS